MRPQHSFATILVGKSSLLREGVARILRAANFRILTSVSCADEFLTSKARPRKPLFLVVRVGDNSGGVAEQIELLRGGNPSGRIVVVADRYRLDELVSAFRVGANGYFVGVMRCDVFVKSIELVMMGQTLLPPAFLSFVLESGDNHLNTTGPRDDNSGSFLVGADALATQLSPREKAVLRYLIEGASNKSIAQKFDIAEATVKVHVKMILRKIRVHNRTQAAIWGMNNGWLPRTSGTSLLVPAPSAGKRSLGREL